jgi:hypothetical protein
MIRINTDAFKRQIEEAAQATGNIPAEIQAEAFQKVLVNALKPASAAMRKTVPQPGYPGDKPGLVPLKRTIRTKAWVENGVWTVKAGPPGVGHSAHAGLVEFGHKIIRTKPGPAYARPVRFIEQAIKQTRQIVETRLRTNIGDVIEEKWQKSPKT